MLTILTQIHGWRSMPSMSNLFLASVFSRFWIRSLAVRRNGKTISPTHTILVELTKAGFLLDFTT